MPNIDTRTSPYVGLTWPVEGSRGDKYSVQMLPTGFVCTCLGFRRAKKGFCKHVEMIDELVGGDHADPVYSRV